jgi:putative peptidoglycan lipid II flippase
LGIIGIALGTAILPSLSRHVASADHDQATRLQSNAVELAMLLTVPAAAALFVTGSAFTRVFFAHGAFTAEDAMITGTVVSGLVIGLPAYVLVKVLTPSYFARKDTRTPVYTAMVGLAVTIGLNLILVPRLGVMGLAISGSAGAWINIALLYVILTRRAHFTLPARIWSRIARILLAAAIMGTLLYWLMPYGDPFFLGSWAERLGAIVVLILAGLASFALAAMALGILDRSTVDRLMRRSA